MHHIRALAALALLTAPLTAISAQESITAAAARPAKPPTIVIGLKKWTRDQVNDTLVRRFGDSEGLESHACGANLMEVGFPRTSAFYFSSKNAPAQTVVALVEPGDTSAIQAIRVGNKSAPLPAGWAEALQPYTGTYISRKDSTKVITYLKSNEFNNALRLYTLVARGQADSAKMFAPKAKLTEEQMKLWDFLSANKSADSKAQALNILANDSSGNHRALAAAVLFNFGTTDDTWHTLLHHVRDPSQSVDGVAAMVLSLLTGTTDRKIDWAPAAEDARALLAGSDLWNILTVMGVLSKTEIDPSLAKKVLADNGTYVLGYAAINTVPAANLPARRLLKQLSGQDYADNVDKWKAWIDTL